MPRMVRKSSGRICWQYEFWCWEKNKFETTSLTTFTIKFIYHHHGRIYLNDAYDALVRHVQKWLTVHRKSECALSCNPNMCIQISMAYTIQEVLYYTIKAAFFLCIHSSRWQFKVRAWRSEGYQFIYQF